MDIGKISLKRQCFELAVYFIMNIQIKKQLKETYLIKN